MLVKAFAPGFFARGDTATPVKIGIVVVVVNLSISLSLLHLLAHVGIALATATAAWVKAEAYDLQTLATVTRLSTGDQPGAVASLTKIWWSELDIELQQLAMDLAADAAEEVSSVSSDWQFALAGPIYAGTNEIQRNIAAERLLGLPR